MAITSQPDRSAVQELIAYLNSLPLDAKLEIVVRNGVESRGMNTAPVESKPNGSQAILIKINGGAEDTEGEPEFMETARRLSRER